MDQEKYKLYRMATVAVISLVTALGVNYNNWWIPLLFVLTGFAFLYYLRKNLDDIIYDERVIQIRTKASAMTLSVSVIGLVLVGAFLLLMSKNGYPQYEDLAYASLYLSNIILMINAVFGWYYGRKFG